VVLSLHILIGNASRSTLIKCERHPSCGSAQIRCDPWDPYCGSDRIRYDP